jgi:hypothetical protein
VMNTVYPIVYEVEVTGDRAPYKWKVYRSGGPAASRSSIDDAEGETDTFAQACDEATERAHELELIRKHRDRVETVCLFVVEKPEELVVTTDELESMMGLSEPADEGPEPEIPPTPLSSQHRTASLGAPSLRSYRSPEPEDYAEGW